MGLERVVVHRGSADPNLAIANCYLLFAEFRGVWRLANQEIIFAHLMQVRLLMSDVYLECH